MNSVSKSIKEEILKFRTLELISTVNGIIEKIFWSLIALAGTIWFFYFMSFQIKLWNENKIVISPAATKLSDIKYPAVTFCSPSANKYGVAERLGNYLNPNIKVNHEFLTWIRKVAVNCISHNGTNKDMISTSDSMYKQYCVQMSPNDTACKVKILFDKRLITCNNFANYSLGYQMDPSLQG